MSGFFAFGRRHTVCVGVSVWVLLRLGPAQFDINEGDLLPIARQFADPTWLPADWYLNLQAPYRTLFNLIVGPLCLYLPFSTVSTIGRFGTAIGIGCLIERYCVTFSLNPWLMLPWIWVFVSHQSVVAREWIVAPGFEAKVPAYLCVLYALTALHRRQYTSMLLALGLGCSFHILVGLYASATAALLLVLDPQHRPAWPLPLRRSWIAVLAGCFGVFAILREVVPDGASRAQALRAAEIYVRYRNPHHVWPGAWGSVWHWGPRLALWTGLLVLGSLREDVRSRFLARIGLLSLSWFGLGYLFYALGQTALLKYYLFRFPDTVVPFLASAVVVVALGDLLEPQERGHVWTVGRLGQAAKVGATVLSLLAVALPWVLTGTVGIAGWTFAPRRWIAVRIPPAMMWIRRNTARDAIFLVDPSSERFYLNAERPMFATWKQAPQRTTDLLEWFDRLSLVNGQEPRRRGFALRSELASNYRRIDEARIRAITEKYRLDYCVVPVGVTLPFIRVYADHTSAIYALR